jgi:hypothetical protein
MLLPAGEHRDTKIADRSFEKVRQVKYLGTTLTIPYLIQEEIKSRRSSGNACYHSVQNILSVVLYMCETWSLTLRE